MLLKYRMAAIFKIDEQTTTFKMGLEVIDPSSGKMRAADNARKNKARIKMAIEFATVEARGTLPDDYALLFVKGKGNKTFYVNDDGYADWKTKVQAATVRVAGVAHTELVRMMKIVNKKVGSKKESTSFSLTVSQTWNALETYNKTRNKVGADPKGLR